MKVIKKPMTKKKKILAIVSSIFSLAAAAGSTLLSPEQRELILKFINLL